VDLAASFLVGDDERDVEAARRAGVRARRIESDGDLGAALAELLGA
jgi:histidinol phosphatase-like enzyme